MAKSQINFGELGGGGSSADLLWTNPSPTSAFSAQTVSLDLTSYDAVLVEARYNTSGANKSIVYVVKGTVDGSDGKLSRCYASSNQMIMSVSNSGIAFSTASGVGSCIPTRIWGVSENMITD